MTYVEVNVIILTPIYFFLVVVFPENKYNILLIDTFLNFWLEMLSKQSKCFRFSTFNPSFCPWPLACLSWDSARNCRILSEGIAKDIPAVTFSVLIPITSPSYSNGHKNQDTNVYVNSHKHTAHLHAQMSSCHNGMFPPLIIMHEHMCLWSRLTQHRALLPTYVSRLIKTCYKHYQPWLHSVTPVNSLKIRLKLFHYLHMRRT